MKHGPNVNRLIIEKMSTDAIPPGGGIAAGIEFLLDAKKISAGVKAAETWVMEAIRVMRLAKAPNPYQTMSDEEIAEAILKSVQEKKRENLKKLLQKESHEDHKVE